MSSKNFSAQAAQVDAGRDRTVITVGRRGHWVVATVLMLVLGAPAHAGLDPSGELDMSFDQDGINSTNFALVNTFAEARGVAVQKLGANAGKIVVGGGYQDGFNTHFALLRIAANGTQDFGFGTGGQVKTAVGGYDLINDIALQADDKIVVAGFVGDNGGDYAVTRYLPNGALDSSWGGDGIVTAGLVLGEFDRGHAVAIQSDSKVLVAGYSYTSAATGRDLAVVRFNTDGSLDTGFGGGDGFATVSLSTTGSDQAYDVTVQPDGKIVVVGRSGNSDSTAVVRFNANGALDTSFSGDGIDMQNLPRGGESLRGVSLQSDGKIVAVGAAATTQDSFFNPKYNLAMLRYNVNGTLDTSFDTDGKVFTIIAPVPTSDGCPVGYYPPPLTDMAEDVRIQADGKILVGAHTQTNGGANCTFPAKFAVLRYTSTGALDTTYDTDGVQVLDPASIDANNFDAMTLDNNGHAVVVGYRSVNSGNPLPDTYISAARLTSPAGALDAGFAGDGIFDAQLQGGSVEQGYGLGVQSTGKTVVVGYTTGDTSADFGLVRYDTNGALDTVFGGDGKATGDNAGKNDTARAIAIQSDDKIVVAGDSYGTTVGSAEMTLMRFNLNGVVLDSTFSGDGITTVQFGTVNNSNSANAVLIQPDGKIVAAGATSEGAADWNFAVARFNANGTLDTSFDGDGKLVLNLSIGNFDQAQALALQGDNKILVGGLVFPNTSRQDFALVRLNANGSLDTGFGTGGIVTTAIGAGQFARNEIRGIALLPDGKIVVGGKGNNGTGTSNNVFRLARYNPNGTLDASFGSGGIVTTNLAADRFDEAYAVAVQRDEKIVAFGSSMRLYVTNDQFALVRYNWDDGSIDTTFGPGNVGYTLTALSSSGDRATGGQIRPDGTLVAGGTAGGSDVGAARYMRDPAPIVPGKPDLAAASDSGASNADNITRDNTPTFNGTCNVGDTIYLAVDSVPIVPAVRQICRTGGYTLTPPTLADGIYTVRAFARNGSADSVVSAGLSINVDTVATPPLIQVPAQNAQVNVLPAHSISGKDADGGAKVDVLSGATPVCTTTADGAGFWSCVSNLATAGVHTIQVRQSDLAGNVSGLSANRSFTLIPIATTTTLTSSPSPSKFGQQVTFTATVSAAFGAPGGTVSFSIDGQAPQSYTLSSGSASTTISVLVPGTHTISASYQGSTNFAASQTTRSQVVEKANTAMVLSVPPAATIQGDPATFKATVSAVAPGAGTPSGTVGFVFDGQTPQTANLIGGVATLTTSALSAGSHTVSAVYAGDAGFNGTSTTGAAHRIIGLADLALSVESAGVAAQPGDEIAYALSYENKGGSAVAAVFISETVPQNTTFVAARSSAGWSCVPGVAAGSVCTLELSGSLNPLQAGVATFVVQVDSGLGVTGGESISNTAVIGDRDDQTVETFPLNNTSTDLTALQPPSTPTPTATPVGPSATPTGTPAGPESTPTETPNGPGATPTETPAGPGATPTGTPNGPGATPTGLPADPTATPVGAVPQVPAMNGPFWLWASLILVVGVMGLTRRSSGRTE